jgi:hypothetical protein
LDVGQQQSTLANQVGSPPQKIARCSHFGRIGICHGHIAAHEQLCNLVGIDLVVFCFSAMDGFHVQGVPQNEWDFVLVAKIGNPVPGKHAFNADDDIFKVWEDGIKQQRRVGIKVLVQFGLSLGIDDADIHFSCMQIDAAVKFVTLIVKSHNLPPFSFSGLMVGVSIAYTVEFKEATRSDIFRLRMGLQFARRRPENIGPGYRHLLSWLFAAAITSIL